VWHRTATQSKPDGWRPQSGANSNHRRINAHAVDPQECHRFAIWLAALIKWQELFGIENEYASPKADPMYLTSLFAVKPCSEVEQDSG
jgi:hypothetical protein